jgi:hypothetical protein
MSNQLDGLEPKDIIKRVTGKITKLFPEKQHEGDYGPYTIQNGEIEVDGKAYKLALWKSTQPESAKGRTVTLSSTRGKHGLNGVTFEEESYPNKEGQRIHNQVIKVTASAKVEYDGVSEEPARVTSTPKSIVNDNPEKALDEIVETHQYIDSLVRMAYLGKVTDEETLRSYVSSVFIEANRKGISISKSEPKAEPKAEPAELDPADWATAIVPLGHPKFRELGGKKLAEIGKPALTKLYQYFLEKGFNTPFAKCVEQAAIDLNLDAPVEDADEIPW